MREKNKTEAEVFNFREIKIDSPLKPFEIYLIKLPWNTFTIRFLQQADVIQLTDGGECFGTTPQLAAEAEVACPVPVVDTRKAQIILQYATVNRPPNAQQDSNFRLDSIKNTRDCGMSRPSSA